MYDTDDSTHLPTLVDSHCHLDYVLRDGKDLVQTLTNAHKNGVRYMQTISVTMQDFPKTLAVAQRFQGVFASVGVHPCYVQTEPLVVLDTLIQHAENPEVIAIGESGLDSYYTQDHAQIQEHSFRTHICAARETGLPLIVHTRSADSDTVRILRDEYNKGTFTAVIHCFSASRDLAVQCLDMGFYISVSGIITFPKGETIRNIVAEVVPMDRILVETDSPYLAPIPYRGKRCEPAYTLYTAQRLADVMGVSYDTIAHHTTHNFFTLFKKAVQ